MDSAEESANSSTTRAADSENLERDSAEPMLFCPVCSRRLTSRKCKLSCEQCGYFMSCADYY